MKLAIGVLYTLLPEIALFAVAALLAGHVVAFSYPAQLALQLSACAILLAALGLCVQFNRSRMFFGLLSLLLAYAVLLTRARATDPFEHAALGGLLSLFLPVDLLVFSSIPERGIFSRYAGTWYVLLAAELLAGWGVLSFPSPLVIHALHVDFLPLPAMAITQPGLLAAAVGLLWVNDQLLCKHSAELAAFFLALFVVIPLMAAAQAAGIAVYVAVAGLAFGYALVQESWSMAYLDELTGLQSRRALEEQLRQLGGRYVIAMLDVDHFKKFNDRYGHDVGDQVLRFVASRLLKHTITGKPYRYGGEEFCLVYAGRGLPDIGSELEQLRADIESCHFDLRQRERRSLDIAALDPDATGMLSVTVSIGAAECGADHAEPWSVLKAADQALYGAKHAGRNRVNLAGV
ncbi:MAG TPA: GGDEF domain-containing protein [Gammaproteobacteria bacterium]|jgi:diguanylate cyclase (GGDEF)-like protein|nr:GGDEF domain-containing protein [Gammaproteobacteria bacterium]